MFSDLDRKLCQALCDHPRRHDNRYSLKAQNELLDIFFRSLTNDRSDYLDALFPLGFPLSYKLRDAQGIEDEAEYTAAARGRPCGHIFKPGEASYQCSTCTDDSTCVLCARCFDSSDHEGHQVTIKANQGNSGCCDCGDDEAWKTPVKCAIHTAHDPKGGADSDYSRVPTDLQESIRTTISRVLDYFCDVISCSPENLRVPKTVETIKHDESYSRLGEKYYMGGDDLESNPEYCLVLWNDEKHSIRDVQMQVARACHERESFGLAKAHEADDIGRSVIRHSRNLEQLIQMSKIIEHIKVTVTIRSSRDTFREQMCGTIVQWLSDIAGCKIGGDNQILQRTICEEMLSQWRIGSEAYNAKIGKNGIDDHEIEANLKQRQRRLVPLADPFHVLQQVVEAGAVEVTVGGDMTEMDEAETAGDEPENEEDDDEDDDDQEIDETTDDNHEVDDDEHMQMDDEAEGPEERPQVSDDEMEMDAGAVFLDAHESIPADIPAGPPPRPPAGSSMMPPASIEAAGPSRVAENKTQNFLNVPRTPNLVRRQSEARPPNYWAILPSKYSVYRTDLPAHEDLSCNIRLDSMILFDLRLWKQARIELRDLYISTVVNIPEFKRILGLRFSGLYITLSQLYLVADREPDHSIINLSLQMLTSPSITEEVIERGNFLTNLMAILYTFLTTRQVGFPKDVDLTATLAFDAGSVTNRRLYHFFSDLRWFLSSAFVQERVRTERQYLLQFLDLAKLSQGICPNVRAVGEHVEYETDAWINASLLTREINKLCRQFAESFQPTTSKHISVNDIYQAILHTACVAIVNSLGQERKRFDQAEVKELTRFKSLRPFQFEHPSRVHRVVDFVVEKGSLSFHHALHYTLSWLLEFGRDTAHAVESLREAARQTISMLHEPMLSISYTSADDALLALFDFPLRVCAWLAQMKAGMWVRNGLSLRHQMFQYKNGYRDVGHHRDLVLLQTAFVACDPSRVLASMIDRFGLDDWVRGEFQAGPDYDESQLLEIIEDFIFLLINLLSDRDSLIPLADEPQPSLVAVRKDIVHTLCFKPLSFSDLSSRLTERAQDYENLQQVLQSMTDYKPPEGFHDTGMFELKSEYLQELDPYNSHFNKNQRDEAENIYKQWMASKTKKPADEIVLEPALRRINSGAFVGLGAVTQTPLFAQVVYACLLCVARASTVAPTIPLTRVETFLNVVLQLTLIASLEDETVDESVSPEYGNSFVWNALNLHQPEDGVTDLRTIITALHRISSMDEYVSCRSKIKHILKIFMRKREVGFAQATKHLQFPYGRLDTASPANAESELEAKKRQARDRNSKVLAQFQQQQQNFMDKHGMQDWGEEDFDDSEIDAVTSTEIRAWKYPSGVCIQCREETNDSRLYGTFAMITESNVLRQTNIKDPDFVQEVLDMPASLDKSIENRRPYGVSGANHEPIRRLTATGQAITIDRQGLGKGWPYGYTMRCPVSSSCGHIMHFACFENYYNSVIRRHGQQIARNHPERTDQKEFVCPLCKAMGNAFLPILWKCTEQSYPSVLATELSFDSFLDVALPGRPDSRRMGHASNDPDITKEHETTLSGFSNPALAPGIAACQSGQMSLSPTAQLWASRPDLVPFLELMKIYGRLKDTLAVTKQNSRPLLHSANRQQNFGVLLMALAGSVCATEIAYRGQDSEYGSTLLSRIPHQTLSHLQVLSATVRSYAAVESLVMRAVSDTDYAQVEYTLSRQMFCEPRPAVSSMGINLAVPPPLLSDDPFKLFTAASIVLCRTHNLEIRHVLQLYYTAEILRVVLVFASKPDSLATLMMKPKDQNDRPAADPETTAAGRQALKWTLDWLEGQITESPNVELPDRPRPGFLVLQAPTLSDSSADMMLMLIRSYALAFLRKAVILLHVAHGVDFPEANMIDAPLSELERLSNILKLPSISSILSDFSEFSGKITLKTLAGGWVKNLVDDAWSAQGYDSGTGTNLRHSQLPRLNITLLHPAPLELIGLPKHFDVLMDESHRRRCPTSGKELADPALCLFCGEMFCAQAVCCMRDGRRGGCNQHIEKCSGPIGIFLFVRKCQILLLHVAIKEVERDRDRELRLGPELQNPGLIEALAAIVRGGRLPTGRRSLPAIEPGQIQRPRSGTTSTTTTTTISHGSFFPAPYLTKHGETDSGLRSHFQLILNQKRYDKLLRDCWLMTNGNVWSAVARKLEGESNAGGWETL